MIFWSVIAMSSEELSDEECSEDSVTVDEVLEMVLEGDALHYLCRKEDGSEEVYDRSDLIDGAEIQRKVLAFERRHPPPWDTVCMYCENEGCEECICDICDRRCRHIGGVNYGCSRHPVV